TAREIVPGDRQGGRYVDDVVAELRVDFEGHPGQAAVPRSDLRHAARAREVGASRDGVELQAAEGLVLRKRLAPGPDREGPPHARLVRNKTPQTIFQAGVVPEQAQIDAIGAD